jgi:hypothetical protein
VVSSRNGVSFGRYLAQDIVRYSQNFTLWQRWDNLMNVLNMCPVVPSVTPCADSKYFALATGLLLLMSLSSLAVPTDELAAAAKVEWQWGVKIPLRDGVRLNATLYKPSAQKEPRPCLFTLTPHIGQTYHDRGMYFAAHNYPFLTIDVCGRGNLGGSFQPFIRKPRTDTMWLGGSRNSPTATAGLRGGEAPMRDTINGQPPRNSRRIWRPSYRLRRLNLESTSRRGTTFSGPMTCNG